jgi:hypothetical protein
MKESWMQNWFLLVGDDGGRIIPKHSPLKMEVGII